MKTYSLIITAILLLSPTLSAQETTAADLMAKGLYEEKINSDLSKASQYYERILKDFPSETKTAAKASLNLAIIKESLGQLSDAHDQYKKTIQEYPNETIVITEAQTRLTNSSGASYFIDPRDNHSYKYVQIGSLIWMAENLAYIPKVGPVNEQSGIWVLDYEGHSPKEAKKNENYNEYGCLYDFKTAMISCPPGWHLPTGNDWKRLEQFLGYYDIPINEPNKMSLRDNSINQYLTAGSSPATSYLANFTGLSLTHGGSRLYSKQGNSRFFRPNINGYYWGSSNTKEDNPWIFYLYSSSGHNRSNIYAEKSNGYSVRCIKDKTLPEPRNPKGLQFFFDQNDDKKTGYSILQVLTHKDDLVDSIMLFIDNHGVIESLGIEYSSILSDSRQSRSSNNFYFGWDTRNYNDGTYNLFAVSYYFDGYSDTASITLQTSNDNLFDILPTVSDSRDGKEYPYVKVGNQTWMAHNMNLNINDGVGSFCYKNLEAHCETYGRLYTFETAKKACPDGWHLPTYDDWTELEIFLGFDTTMLEGEIFYLQDSTGSKLKSKFGWKRRYNQEDNNWQENSNGTNFSRMSILPAGYMKKDGSFVDMFEQSNFWINSRNKFGKPEIRELYNFLDCIGRDYLRNQYYAASVRCIKD